MQSVVTPAIIAFERVRTLADAAGAIFGLLAIRLVLAREYGDAGIKKLRGTNWFEHVQSDFPFPFNILSIELSWFLATWTELLGAVALAVGFATRFAGISLFILTVVAWMSVHAGNGYNVCDNGFKLPLIFLAMLIPVILNGAGKLSLDYLVQQRYSKVD